MVVMPRSPLVTEAFAQIVRTRGAAIASAVIPDQPVVQEQAVASTQDAEIAVPDEGAQQATGPLSDTLTRALAAVAQLESLDSFDQLVADLQGQITALTARVDQQAEQLARVNAAMQCFDCPDNLQDPSYKERHVASVAVCQQKGICTCDVGYMLNMPSVPVPPSESPSGEAEGAAATDTAAVA